MFARRKADVIPQWRMLDLYHFISGYAFDVFAGVVYRRWRDSNDSFVTGWANQSEQGLLVIPACL